MSNDEPKKTSFPPTRLTIALMLFATTFVSYITRVNLSISILGMVYPRHVNQTDELPDYGPRYEWSNAQQSLILSAFFYGLISTELFGGLMNQMLGPRVIVGVGLGLSAFATALVPLAAETTSFWAVFAVRMLLGALAGITLPGLSSTIANWSPPQETGKFMFASVGGTLGTVVTWPMVAYLMTNFGWAFAFYIPAAIVLVITMLWFYIVYNSPSEHPRISATELEYIQSSQGHSVSKKKGFPPIRRILKSPPFWGLFILHFGHMWSFYFLQVAAPKYLNEVLKFDLTQAGFLSSAPYLCRFIFGFVFGSASDYLIKHKLLTVTKTRKYFSIFSHVLPGLLLFSLRFVSDNPMHCVILIIVAMGFNGATTAVNLPNRIDLAPNYAPILSSIISTFTTTAGILAPMVVSFFTREHNTVNEWNSIFLISSVLFICSAVVFVFIGSGEVQDWNFDTNRTESDVEQKKECEMTTKAVSETK